jgi:hypothetical protein
MYRCVVPTSRCRADWDKMGSVGRVRPPSRAVEHRDVDRARAAPGATACRRTCPDAMRGGDVPSSAASVGTMSYWLVLLALWTKTRRLAAATVKSPTGGAGGKSAAGLMWVK